MGCYPRLMRTQRRCDSYHADYNQDDNTFVANFNRSNTKTGIGLTIAGGSDRKIDPFIAKIRQNSLADRCEYFCIGDLLLEVNSQSVKGLTHRQIIDLVTDSGKVLSVKIKPIPTNTGPLSRTANLMIQKQPNWERIIVQGGSSLDGLMNRPIMVRKIISKDGKQIFSKSGLPLPSDIILSINSKSVEGLGSCDVQQWLDSLTDDFTLEIKYYLSETDVKHLDDDSVMVTITRPSEILDWGISLDVKFDGGVFISEIKSGSPADRHRALRKGQELLAVGPVAVATLQIEDTLSVMQSYVSSLKLHVRPSTHCDTSLESSKENFPTQQIHPPPFQSASISISTLPCRRPRLPSSVLSLGGSELCRSNVYSSMTTSRWANDCTNNDDHRWLDRDRFLKSSTVSGLSWNHSSVSQRTQPQPERLDGCECMVYVDVLCDSFSGLGCDVDGYRTDDPDSCGLKIRDIHPCSDLARCGKVKVGDRLVSVNGIPLHSRSDWPSVTHGLLGKKVTLGIKFNIHDHTVPTSGTFIVRLNVETLQTGIILAAPVSATVSNDKLRVRQVIRGSAAHRVGSIFPGDELLTIDNKPFDAHQLEEAKSRLACPSDSIQLKLKKDEMVSGPTFTIELPCADENVGIYLAGDENDPFAPIYIDALDSQSTIQRCGAVFAGDRVLAVNDTSLRGYTVAEANELLNQCNDKMILKLTLLRDGADSSITRREHTCLSVNGTQNIDKVTDKDDGKQSSGHCDIKSTPSSPYKEQFGFNASVRPDIELDCNLLHSPFNASAVSDCCKKLTFTTPKVLKPIRFRSQLNIDINPT